MATSFAGIIYPDVLQVSDLIDGMLAALHHRAPNGRNVHTFKNFQIGCLGDGTAFNSKRNIHVFLDGWIENSSQFKEEFKALGAPSDQATDSEIILQAYESFGDKFLEKLNGEFALMVLDAEKGQLLLARDPIGKKPLYWYHDKHYFIFASELKAILATGIVPQTPASDALSSYFFFGFIPQDMTGIKDVNKLLPAHYLLFSNMHGNKVLPYWSYSSFFSERVHMHKSTIIARINELLETSVRARIPNTGDLGCIVSGGLGSASIAYYVERAATDRTVEAFTAGFNTLSEEDFAASRAVCKSLAMKQEIGEVTPTEFLKNFPKIVWYLDEPIADPNVLATWKVAEIASNHCKTVYSGMGSDELLAGHNRYSLAERDAPNVNRLLLLPRPILHHLIIPLIRLFNPSAAFNLLKVSRTNPSQFEFLRHMALFNESQLREAAPKLAGYFDSDTFLHKFHNLGRIQSNVSSFLYFDVKTRLPDCYMIQYERLMRAFQLNWQTPFLDRSLVEFAAHLPEPESLMESETASYLKPLIRDVFPEAFINRPKKTRKNFVSSWIEHPEVRDVFQMLTRGTLVETGLVSEEWLHNQLSDIEQMERSFHHLFAILTLEVWFRLFVNRAVTYSPPSFTIKELLQET